MKSMGIDLSRHISLQISALKLFGIWFFIPYGWKNVRFWICVWTRIVLGIAVFVVPTGSQLIYVVKLILSGNAEIQEVAGILLFHIPDKTTLLCRIKWPFILFHLLEAITLQVFHRFYRTKIKRLPALLYVSYDHMAIHLHEFDSRLIALYLYFYTNIIMSINLILTELLVSLRLLDLSLRRHRLMQLCEQLRNEEFQFHLKDQKDILEKAVRFSRRMFWILACSCSSDVLVHVVVVPALHNFESLPLKMDLILIDVNNESYFNYLCAYQILYKPMVLATFTALQTLPWAAMCCAISQLDVLIHKFENMKDLVKTTAAEMKCTENEAFKEIFKGCVLHHCSIIRFVSTIQDVFSGQLSATLFLSTGILGTTAVQIFSIESPLKNMTEVAWVLAYLSIIICNLFIDCYFGNTITVKSLHVSEVAFSCPWIEQPTTLKKNLVIFIAKTQRPLVITAVKLVPVSLETFTKVMNWTYKGFAVMNQMKK